MDMHYTRKELRPQIEEEIKGGFFEIKKKFTESDDEDGKAKGGSGDDVQVYVSHLCLHNFHPIFCKFQLETVK